MITHELLREMLNDRLGDLEQIAEFVPNEIVYKALIIREFMDQHGIASVREGIRRFYAFERARLYKLRFAEAPAFAKGNGHRSGPEPGI